MYLHLPPSALEQLSDIITKNYPHCSVFVFGYRSRKTDSKSTMFVDAITTEDLHHFDVLVFVGKATAYKGADIANTISDQSDKSITASVLLHRVTELGTKDVGQLLFFDKVLRESYRLCIDKSALPYLPSNPEADSNKGTAEAYWLKCVAVAQFNIQCAEDNPQLDVELCKIALLHSACVQIALGLTKVFLGYTPNEYSLNHLLTLCGHCTDMPLRIFNPQSPEGKRRYKMLCTPPSMLNHWRELHARESDLLWLLDACEQFLELSSALVTKKFEIITT